MRKFWPYLTGLFSIVAASIVAYTFVSGLTKPKGKRIDAAVQQRTPLLNPAVSSGVDSLSLSVGTRVLHNPQVVQVRFRSSGADPIMSTDFDGPISIRFKGQGEVVAANVVAPYPADLGIASQLRAGNQVTLDPFLMNPGDTFVVSVLYIPAISESSAADIPIDVSGRIAGIQKIGIEDVSQRHATRAPISSQLATIVSALTALLAFIMWATTQAITRRLRAAEFKVRTIGEVARILEQPDRTPPVDKS